MRFIVREIHFNTIIMSSEFEALSKSLMVEIIRRRQLQLVRSHFHPFCSNLRSVDIIFEQLMEIN